jgi:hypothetical protein
MATKQQITVTTREQSKFGVTLNPYQRLYCDPQTGLAWIENGSAGLAHTLHPNCEANRYTRRKYPERLEVRGFLYDVQSSVSDEFAPILQKYCACGGRHG